jgi:hypothetical protein
MTHDIEPKGYPKLDDPIVLDEPTGYPRYEVNHRPIRNRKDAQMYWQVYGGVLMEKIDAMTPWHVLQTKALTKFDETSDETVS